MPDVMGAMNQKTIIEADAVIIGSGMGGVSAACMMTKNGMRVVVLEAAYVPGGCSSSYKRKGYVFESGATTLVGFDEHQPMQTLERELGIEITKTELSPSMVVHLNGRQITRHKDREAWINEAISHFGNPEGQRSFWNQAFSVADTVWRVSGNNVFFPPKNITDWMQLAIVNHPKDAPTLRFVFSSVLDEMKKHEVATPEFIRFADEQLMITAQAGAAETPFIFGAAGLTYTNYSNYYVNGGLLNMVEQLRAWMQERGSEIKTRRKVTALEKNNDGTYLVKTENGEIYRAPVVVSNIPVWNLGEIADSEMKPWFESQSKRYQKAWGAFTMGIVCEDTFDAAMPLHHQLHLPENETMPLTGAGSVFVSMSARGDISRAPEGLRTLNVSCHTETAHWFTMNGDYDTNKQKAQDFVLSHLKKTLPGLADSEIKLAFSATPVTWQNWVYRKEGRVGGIPQSMSRSVIDWPPAETPFPGFFLCGDTIYPGQGIPGVTLGGINVYYRIEKYLKN